MDALSDNFSSEYSLITLPSEEGMAMFEQADLVELSSKSSYGIAVAAFTGADEAIVFSVSDPGHVLPETLNVTGSEVRVGTASALSGDLTLVDETSQEVEVVGRYSSSIFSDEWILGSPELLMSLTDQAEGTCNYAIVKDLSPDQRSSLEREGFSVQPLISIVDFLDSSIDELEADMYWILLPSAFVIAVLAYSFISSEVSDRRHDIGIIKTIGAGRRRVFGYLVAESALMCAYGGVLGLALGIVMSYAVSTFASHIFTSVFVIEMDEPLLLISYAVTVGAGVLGALIPAVRMTLSSPVKDLREVIPF
jgi:ABC-type antimicrobial peptide transport system permease subunit